MKIERIYNNNVAQSINEKGQDVIVMGRGLAFQKRIGEDLDEQKIEKVFVSEDQQTTKDLSKLYEQIPGPELDVLMPAMDQAEKELGLAFDTTVHLSLMDHLHYMTARVKQGVTLTNPLSWEVRKYYPKEYHVALNMLETLREKLGLEIPDDEASSIALHFANAQTDSGDLSKSRATTRLVTNIVEIVRLHFGPLPEETIYYNRFITHLQYFAQRVITGTAQGNNDDFLYEQVQKNYPESFKCTQKIKVYVESHHHFSMSMDEQVYLTIHIQRLIKSV